MIGIVGYAVRNEIGLMVQALRENLGISQQMSIYNHVLGGWDMAMGADSWLNGAPQDRAMRGRYEWTVHPEDLSFWVRDSKIKTVIFVGNMYGGLTSKFCRKLRLRLIVIPTSEYHDWLEAGDVDKYICITPELYKKAPVSVSRKTLLHFPVSVEGWDLMRDLWKDAIA